MTLQWVYDRFQALGDIAVKHYIDYAINIVATISIGIFLYNYKLVVRYFARTIAKTDVLIAGKWFVYRYTKTQGRIVLLTDIWDIKRSSISKQYVVYISPQGEFRRNRYKGSKYKGNKYRGTVTYNERDRLNILLLGSDHKEQSLICFVPRIPADSEAKMIGLGVGDDADYVLSARIYFASRASISEDYAKSIIDDATDKIVSLKIDQLIQLSSDTMIKIMNAHPIP